MKKLMIMGVGMLMAVAAHATAYNWSSYLGGSTYDGLTYYAINGTGVDALVNYLAVDGDTSSFSSALAAYGKNAQSGTFGAGWEGYAEGSFSTTGEGAVSAISDKFFMVAVGDLSAGSTFYYTEELSTSGHTYEGGGVPAPPISIGSMSSATIADVPEPTSAMLVLLGVAGLALKRRRA